MKRWCKGSKALLEQLQDFIDVEPLGDDASAVNRGDVVIVDFEETSVTGAIEVLKHARAKGGRAIGLSRTHRLTQLVRAVREGVEEVLPMPVRMADLARHGLIDLVEHHHDVPAWREKHAPEVVGSSPGLMAALEMAIHAAEFDCPVLITGESGTGKELLAQAIHRASVRSSGPFIPVNCPAIPKELVESELFGHSKGAFTGATAARVGRFSAAHNGTLMLDEIGEMDLTIQAKLLRALQDYKITPVGESRHVSVDVRVIAATNRDLETMASRGEFREDLFYRLNVVQIHLPPLRERRGDVDELIAHFLEDLSRRRQVKPPVLSEEARAALLDYHWPGNIRQLRNVIERLVIVRRGRTVTPRHLPNFVQPVSPSSNSDLFRQCDLPEDGMDLRLTLQRFEETMIKKALLSAGGNKNLAAKILGLKRTTLVEKLRKRPVPGCDPDDQQQDDDSGIA